MKLRGCPSSTFRLGDTPFSFQKRLLSQCFALLRLMHKLRNKQRRLPAEFIHLHEKATGEEQAAETAHLALLNAL